MTYSVIARDKKTGQLWIAVQTHWFGVGYRVPWLMAWVGAIATQAQTNMDYGKKWLELLNSGKSIEESFQEISKDDEALDMRQVAVIDVEGNTFAHTGKWCVEHAWYLIGDNFIVQGNILTNDTVLPAMKQTYEENIDGDFAVRLMKTLHAGQDAGGELRGQQSAALRIVSGEKDTYDIMNLRIDNDPSPLAKMSWQLDICRAYDTLMDAEEEGDTWNFNTSLELFEKVFCIIPESEEALFWKAFMLKNNGKIEEAEKIFSSFPKDSKWHELRNRLQ